jgi:transposase-like protein
MTRGRCHICMHVLHQEINASILAANESYTSIGKRFGLHEASVGHHARNHLDMPARVSNQGRCFVCRSDDQRMIDELLLGGSSVLTVSRSFNISYQSVENHKTRHLGLPGQSKTCSVCGHPDRQLIEQSLSAGTTVRAVSERFGLHYNSVHRHKQRHMGRAGLSSPRRCAVCVHEQRADIELALLEDKTYRSIGLRYHVSHLTVANHYRHHLRPVIQEERDSLVAQVAEAEATTRRQNKRVLSFLNSSPRPSPGELEGLRATIRSAIDIAEGNERDAAKSLALARLQLKDAYNRYRHAVLAVRDAHQADTELSRQVLAGQTKKPAPQDQRAATLGWPTHS